jgi:hypothetical protein
LVLYRQIKSHFCTFRKSIASRWFESMQGKIAVCLLAGNCSGILRIKPGSCSPREGNSYQLIESRPAYIYSPVGYFDFHAIHPKQFKKQKKGYKESLPVTLFCQLVREGGLEPPYLSAPDPKSGASTNFATLAGVVKTRTLFSAAMLMNK